MSDTSSANASKISGLSNASFREYCSSHLDSNPGLSVRETKSRPDKKYELASLSDGTLLVSKRGKFNVTTVDEWNEQAKKTRSLSSQAPRVSMASSAPAISVQ